MKLFTFLLGLMVTGALRVDAQTLTCQPSSQKATNLRNLAVRYASSPDYAEFRSDYSLGAIDTSTIAVVSQDRICDAVTRAINGVAATQHIAAFIVVKFGNVYAAVDSDGAYISAVYILDDHAQVQTVFVST